jgi:hypothetical protein
VAALRSGPKFFQRDLEVFDLRVEESLQMMGIIHTAIMHCAAAAGKSGSRLLVRREQPRHQIDKNHHWPGHQRQCNEAQPDDCRINSGIVGEPGSDAHDLGVVPIDQETFVHFSSLELLVQAIGSDVAAETNRSAVMNAPANAVAAVRTGLRVEYI